MLISRVMNYDRVRHGNGHSSFACRHVLVFLFTNCIGMGQRKWNNSLKAKKYLEENKKDNLVLKLWMLGFALNVRLKKISGWNHQSILKPTKLCTIFFDLPVHHYARIFKKLVSLTIKLSFSKKKKKKKNKKVLSLSWKSIYREL